MTYQIVDCSPKAAEQIKSYEDAFGTSLKEHHLTKYPFDQMKIGKAFAVPMTANKESTIRVSASAKNRATGKKFVVVKHIESNVFEVARVA